MCVGHGREGENVFEAEGLSQAEVQKRQKRGTCWGLFNATVMVGAGWTF